MTTYVTWPNSKKYHTVSMRLSGGCKFVYQAGSGAGHVTPTTSGKIVTHCGRDVPETNTAVNTLQNIGGDSVYCQSCHRSHTM
jgi:hypothetical protein